jgi:aminobenzoyl-glutamate utilization protein B
MRNIDGIWDLVEAKNEPFIKLSDQVFDTPETLYAEVESCAAHTAMLESRASG